MEMKQSKKGYNVQTKLQATPNIFITGRHFNLSSQCSLFPLSCLFCFEEENTHCLDHVPFEDSSILSVYYLVHQKSYWSGG